MKKLGISAILITLALYGCSEASTKEKDPKPSQQEEQKPTTENYVFEVEGIEIKMMEEAAPLLEQLGEPKDSFEAPSCAFEGMDKVYTYDGFELHTFESDGKDLISGIIFLDDTVSTKEGIYLYSTVDEMLSKYGSDYEKNLTMYSYSKGNTTLSFLIEQDAVASIEYTAKNQ